MKKLFFNLLGLFGYKSKNMYTIIDPKIMDSPMASDTLIYHLCLSSKPLFTPFAPDKMSVDSKGRGIPSYGLSSSGYDMRCDGKLLAFKGDHKSIVDPRKVDPDLFYELEVKEDDTGKYVLLPPNSFILSASLEWVNIPRTHLAMVSTKSTYARVGLQTLVTPLENSWSGYVTLEFVNNTSSHIKVYTEGGVVQVNLFRTIGTQKDYIERGGKYQNQVSGVVHAKC